MPSLAGSRTLWMGLMVSVLLFAGVLSAGTVDLFSYAGTGTNNITGTNISIGAQYYAPTWALPGSSQYEWISYDPTGCYNFDIQTGRCTPGLDNPVATTTTGTPTAVFYQTFVVTDTMDSGYLDVWADDTAAVWLDTGTVSSGTGTGGTEYWAANPNEGSNCANSPIGCLPGNEAQIYLNLPTGTYTLVIDAYQLKSYSPFGLMYDGVLTGSMATPEPASYMLMGLGLAGLGTLIRRLKRS
jgi:hypothetical protein